MRLTRRGAVASGGSSRFVWAVYSAAYGADESTSPYTGSFTLSSSSYYKMTASAYTATSSGFTLSAPSQTSRSALKVGNYLVNVSSSSSSAVSGAYLYRITSISGNTFFYTRWTPVQVRGDYLWEVGSQTRDYPDDGVSGGFWYVILRGYDTVYVWDVFTAEESTEYQSKRASTKIYSYEGQTIYTYNASFNTATGLYTLTNKHIYYVTKTVTQTFTYIMGPAEHWLFENLSTPATVSMVYDGSTNSSGNPDPLTSFTTYRNTGEPKTVYSRGSFLHTQESENASAYPNDGHSQGLWYAFSHTYERPFYN